MTEIDPRSRALEDIVMLAHQHGLSAGEIAAALGAPAPRAAERSRVRSIVVRVLGFLGGTFIFAGIGVFIAIQWADMNSPARVVVTLAAASRRSPWRPSPTATSATTRRRRRSC